MTAAQGPPDPVRGFFWFVLPVVTLLIIPAFGLIIVAVVDGFTGLILSIYALGVVGIAALSPGASRFALPFYRLKFALLALIATTVIAAYLAVWLSLMPLWLSLPCAVASLLALAWYAARKAQQARPDDLLRRLRAKRVVNAALGTFDVARAAQGALDYQPLGSARQPHATARFAQGAGYLVPIALGASFALARLGWEDARLVLVSMGAYGFAFASIYLAVLPGRLVGALRQLERSKQIRFRIDGA